MTYDRERFRHYTRFVYRYRVAVIVLSVFIACASALFFKPTFISNDASLWISGSNEQKRNSFGGIDNVHVLKLTYALTDNKTFEQHLESMRDLHRMVREHEGVEEIRSLLTMQFPRLNALRPDESLLEIETLCDDDAQNVLETIRRNHTPYRPYVSEDFKRAHLYIMTDSAASLERVKSFVAQTMDSPQNRDIPYFLLTALVVAVFAMVFGLIFRSWYPALFSVVILAASMQVTLFVGQAFFGERQIHLAVMLLIMTISVMDFLYIYFRWHVSQIKVDSKEAVHKALNRNMLPAFWTSIVTAAGLGSLILMEVPILHQIGLFAILAAIFGFLFSITLLPAMLSFARLSRARLPFDRLSGFFAASEIHYNKMLLNGFLAVTMIGLLVVLNFNLKNPPSIFDHRSQNDIISLKAGFNDIDVAAVTEMMRLKQELHQRFGSIEKIESVADMIHAMARAEGAGELNDEMVGRYRFLIELYDMQEPLMEDDKAIITILLKKGTAEKSDIIEWIRERSTVGSPLYLNDNDSLLYAAKMDSAKIMVVSIIFALLVIGAVMFILTQNFKLLFIALVINAIPLIWFGVFVMFFSIPLSIEVLIAMTISLGLASDATIHFAYKYIQSRHFYNTRIHALEKLFFYAGIPVVAGNTLLAIIFFSLATFGIQTLEMIGLYAGGLVIISLLTDLFIMPVLLLYMDEKQR